MRAKRLARSVIKGVLAVEENVRIPGAGAVLALMLRRSRRCRSQKKVKMRRIGAAETKDAATRKLGVVEAIPELGNAAVDHCGPLQARLPTI